MATIPTINDVQAVDPVLTNLLIGYSQAEDRFVASKVFPFVPSEKDSGLYYIFTKKYFFMDDLKPRAPGGDFLTVGLGVTSDTYATFQWARSFVIPDETQANSQVPMDLMTAFLKKMSQASLIRKEVAFSTDFMVTGVWATDDNNSATDWDDFSAGDPVANVKLATRTISNNTGQAANTMVMGYIVDEALTLHPDVIDRLKYTQAATERTIRQALAAIFDKENYFVSKATYTNTNEAVAFSATAIIDDDCLICHVDPGAGVFGATAGKTFTWAPGGGEGAIFADPGRHNHGDARQ